MSRFSQVLTRFARDERGVFAVLFGLMAIVLIAMGGAVVDYVSLQQARSRAQTALDAAALALQPTIFEASYDEQTVTDLAQDILIERIGDDRISAEVDSVVRNVEDGSLYLHARFAMPTMFVSLVGVPTLGAAVQAEATRKKLALEVVMVLDNSGSMQQDSRMTNLVAAAKCATNILMYDAVVDSGSTCVPAANAERVEDVKVGIVPFTMFVNVGAGNANAAWIDRFGNSAIADDNFDNDDDDGALPATALPTISGLFAATGENWRGCVFARPHSKTGTDPSEYLDTDDTPPTGGNTLFVPMFSPDMVDGVGTNDYVDDSPPSCDRPAQGNTRCEVTMERTYSYWSGWSAPRQSGAGTPSGPVNFTSSAILPNGYYGSRPPGCSCRSVTYTTNWTNGSTRQTRQGYCNSYQPTGLSSRELQERVCKYYAGVSGSSFSKGPNADCTRTPILPLTDDPATVIDTINAMKAEGGTNIHQGAVWGFRALSPGEPFAEGAPYDEATSKVMIVMTDGENTAYNLCGGTQGTLNGNCYHSAYGFQFNSNNTSTISTSGGNVPRMGNPANVSNDTLVSDMNQRTEDTCTNAKAEGITVYTIGLATDTVTQSTPAVVRAMLTACASSADRARFPDKPSDLKSTFEDIANDLSALRLAL